MSKYPGMTAPFVNQGGREGFIGSGHGSVPITIDGASGRYGTDTAAVENVEGPSLWARKTASPYKALPFFSSAAATSITNTTNFVCDVPDAYAKRFKVGDLVTFYDVSAGALDTGAVNSITVDAVGAAGSGTGGTGFTLVTCTGETFTNTPAASDLLVLADGTQLSANVVVVAGDVEMDGSTDFGETGYINGAFNKGVVKNAAYFVEADNQNIQLLNV